MVEAISLEGQVKQLILFFSKCTFALLIPLLLVASSTQPFVSYVFFLHPAIKRQTTKTIDAMKEHSLQTKARFLIIKCDFILFIALSFN